MGKAFLKVCLFPVILLFIAGGCALPIPYDIHSWVGQNSDTLVKSWGVPSGSYRLSTGEEMMQFNESSLQTYGSNYVSTYRTCSGRHHCTSDFGYISPIGVTSTYCETRFTVGTDGTIRDAVRLGNGCSYRFPLPPGVLPPDSVPGAVSTGATSTLPAPKPSSSTIKNTGTTMPYCRESQKIITIDGKQVKAYGKSCLQPDGSWQFSR